MNSSFLQLNLGKSRLASQLVSSQLSSSLAIGLLSEPYTVDNKVVHIPHGFVAVPEGKLTSRPRAAILVPPQIKFLSLPNLTDSDRATVLVQQNGMGIVVSSIYLDITQDVPVTWLEQIVDYSRSHGYGLLLAVDSNAHSELYGPDSNKRGEIFEDFILSNALDLCNIGEVPTFRTLRASSVIDVTLSDQLHVANWHVSEDFNASDHNTIHFQIQLESWPEKEVRPWHKADWTLFTDSLKGPFSLPERMTKKKVDKEVYRLNSVLQKALDKACPQISARPTSRPNDWQTGKLALEQYRVRKQYNKALRSGSEEEREKYTNMLRKFRRHCSKAKQQSWRRFVSETSNENKMAMLAKIALHKDKARLSVVEKPDGTMSEPGTDTIQTMIRAHFPTAESVPPDAPYDICRAELSSTINEKYTEFITPALVKRALRKFKPFKAPGPDGIKPVAFRHLPDTFLAQLSFLYKCCLHFQYTPKLWRKTNIIFLPKIGKEHYRTPKSFRPIALANFILKGLERLITWRMDYHLQYYPIHPKQHGFTKGKSTEGALSNTCNYIEKYLFKKQFCLGVFLDISSAYDSMSVEQIRNSLYLHGGDDDLVEWYYHYLLHRELSVSFQDAKVTILCRSGFPQGGVASAKFWLIAFNPAIEIINSLHIEGNGYADDCGAVLGGSCPDKLVARMQEMLDQLVQWGHSCNLTFNPSKSIAVGFTRTRRTFETKLVIDNKDIDYHQSVRYLGVLLDRKLFWTQHLDTKIKAAKRYLLKMSNIAKAIWGPKPHLMKWLFECVIRPAVLYGSIVWGHSIDREYCRTRLRRLNRMAINTYAQFPRSSPTRGVEIITDTFPLHLYIKKESLAAYIRLHNGMALDWSGQSRNRTRNISHRQYWRLLSIEFGIDGYADDVDTCDISRPPCDYTVLVDSFNDTAFNSTLPVADYEVYTDGSGMHGRIGAAFLILQGGVVVQEHKIRLPDRSSVFQAEVLAIVHAARWCRESDLSGSFRFFVDSQSALLALQSDFIHSQVVLDAVVALDRLRGPVSLTWIKAHVGHQYNEQVDLLAKEAIDLDDIDAVPLPRKEIRNMIMSALRRVWDEEWANYSEARQTKIFYKGQNRHKAKEACHYSRLQLGRFIRIITGHNNLRYHQSLLNSEVDPTCRFCEQDLETFEHFATDCPVFYARRVEFFLDKNIASTSDWRVADVLDFSYVDSIHRALDPHGLHELGHDDSDSEAAEVSDVDSEDPDQPVAFFNPQDDL